MSSTGGRVLAAVRVAVDEVVVAWYERRRVVVAVGVAAAIVVVAVALIAASVATRGGPDPADEVTYGRLSALADRLGDDLDAGIVTVDDDMVRRFETRTADGLVGTIAQRSPSGRCIGFEVTVPDEWLTDGSGGVIVGTVGEAPSHWCDAPSPDPASSTDTAP